jgi:hypothetical protein
MMENSADGIDAIIAASSTVSNFFRNLDTDKEVRVELPSVAARRDRQFIPALPGRLFTVLAPLPGKALAVYLVLWRRSRVTRHPTVMVTAAAMAQVGISHDQKTRGLTVLEKAGLITVERLVGKNPQVTLRTVDELFPQQEPTL